MKLFLNESEAVHQCAFFFRSTESEQDRQMQNSSAYELNVGSFRFIALSFQFCQQYFDVCGESIKFTSDVMVETVSHITVIAVRIYDSFFFHSR